MAAAFAPYGRLLKRARQIAWLGGAAETLNWDIETYMPPKGIDFRA